MDPKISRWLDLARSRDTTRENLCRVNTRPGYVYTTDGHRAHIVVDPTETRDSGGPPIEKVLPSNQGASEWCVSDVNILRSLCAGVLEWRKRERLAHTPVSLTGRFGEQIRAYAPFPGLETRLPAAVYQPPMGYQEEAEETGFDAGYLVDALSIIPKTVLAPIQVTWAKALNPIRVDVQYDARTLLIAIVMPCRL